ncbi:MAG: RlmE family RNA methyltransferase [Alphaproteobacteria bacterium]|nr:RlmE family RNA methyltransferase [Alphaproteobacteria bacterium]
MATKKNDSGRGKRDLKVKVKTARGRKTSSTRWLQRQLNDPYVTEAKRQGLRSRSAFKLIQMDDQHGFLKPGAYVVDLGAAPGGWSEIAAKRVKAVEGKGKVVAIDMHDIEPIAGVTFLHADFYDDDAPDRLKEALGGPADVVMSDMAAHASGHRKTDHLKIIALCEVALDFACDVLKPGGVFVAKVLQGGTEHELLAIMRKSFRSVAHLKPDASRSDSAELYVLAKDFRGDASDDL